jgi:hypothetical protein
MFLNQLQENELRLYLQLASLLAAIDKELQEDAATDVSDTLPLLFLNLSKIRKKLILVDVAENEYINNAANQTGKLSASAVKELIHDVQEKFASNLNEVLKLSGELDDAMRLKIALKAMSSITKKTEAMANMLPEAKKALLFELYSLALMHGVVSKLEEQLLEQIVSDFDIEDFVANDLFEAAKNINRAYVEAHTIITE